MKRSACAPVFGRIAPAALSGLLLMLATAAHAQILPIETAGVTDKVERFRQMKLFDFDERKLGNYEDSPMHWQRLTGPGLPAFGEAAFDMGVGHNGPPSYRLHTELGSVAAEYDYPDLDVIPGADYLIVGYIRAERVRRSRAFLVAYYLNRVGEVIEESKAVSELVRSQGDEHEPWQRVTIRMSGDQRDAHSLRLQVWLLQTSAYREPDATEIDPIIREDVKPTAWFDDIAVYRLPRARLSFNNAANLVYPGEQGAVLIDVHNSTNQTLHAELTVTNPAGKSMYSSSIPLTPNTTMPVSVTMPPLPPETYHARLQLTNGSHVLIERRLNFAVLNALDLSAASRADMGAALPPNRLHDPDAVHELVMGLHCGLLRLPVPMIGPLDNADKLQRYEELISLTKALNNDRVQVAGMLVAANAAYAGPNATPTHRIITQNPAWADAVNPLLAQHLGRLITLWQLGPAPIEAYAPDWLPDTLEHVREELAQFVSLPQLVVPTSLVRPRKYADVATARWVPPQVPTRTLPLYLEQFADESSEPRWLVVGPSTSDRDDHAAQVTDLARRIALGKALDPDRLIVDAPLELSEDSGAPRWQPTDTYIVMRTLNHYLGGKRGVGALQLENDGVALIFDGRSGSCVVLWTWRSEALESPIDIYLGENPSLVDMWGRKRPVRIEDGKAFVHLTPMPQILVDVDAPLALLQASFELTPTYIQIHQPDPPPSLLFRNYYGQTLDAELSITPPKNWDVTPRRVDIHLAPGETYELPLAVTVPQRHPASEQLFGIRLALQEPSQAELNFNVPIMVGLRDVAVEVNVQWEDGMLVVEHTLRNLSEKPIDFLSRCQAPLRPMVERAFLHLPPGESRTETYVFADEQVDELRGMPMYLRLEEMGGRRELTQVVDIPS